MAIFVALGVLLSFLRFPIFPAAPFLTYEPTTLPSIIGGIAFGPGAGLLIGILSITIQGLMIGDPIGAVMNLVVVIGFVTPLAIICRKEKTTPRLLIGLVTGSLISTIMVVPANLITIPLIYGGSMEDILPMVLPILLPFNILKAMLNSILGFTLFKSLRKLLER